MFRENRGVIYYNYFFKPRKIYRLNANVKFISNNLRELSSQNLINHRIVRNEGISYY